MLIKNKTRASHAQLPQTAELIRLARRIRRTYRARHRQGFYRFCTRTLADVEDEPFSWSDDQEKIRAIGKRLFAQGGRARMLEAWEQVFVEDPRDAKQIEIAWEGIGGWYR